MKDKNKMILYVILVGTVIISLIGIVFVCMAINNKQRDSVVVKPHYSYEKSSFNNKIIQEMHKDSDNKNYMFSPYSLEVVLSILRDGASGKTYEELANLVPERGIKSFSAKERINVANALFIKEGVKVNDNYKGTVINNYNASLIYDKFKTPDVINDWAKKETYGMIPKVLEEISPNFILGLGNAVAIDVNWMDHFECYGTKLEKFKTLDNKNIDVAMMNKNFDSKAAYYKNDKATYVSIPYKKYDKDGNIDYENGTGLEFIGILPEGNVNDFINSYNFDNLSDDLNKMEKASDRLLISVGLPKFKFKSDYDNLISMFTDMGLEETFSSTPNFNKIADYEMFISNFVHKTFIDLNETGTKAAAVTLVTFDKNAVVTEKQKIVSVKFDRPFVFIIKDTETEELLFYGVVYSPDKYTENDILCENEEE